MKNYSKIEKHVAREADPAFARRAKIILRELDLSGEEKVSDVGCGRGFYLRALKTIWPKLEVYGVDLKDEYLSQAKQITKGLKINLSKASILKLPFKENYFDKVIASEILEHVGDDKKAAAEIYRVLMLRRF